jgi:nucleoside-diphosphate-sugar epimerase
MSETPTMVGGKPLILLTGATGYIGGRLLKALEQAGHHVRCLARRPEFLSARVEPTTEVVSGDVLDQGTLPAAMKGVQAAYYLIHSMGSRKASEDLTLVTGAVMAWEIAPRDFTNRVRRFVIRWVTCPRPIYGHSRK